MERKWWTLIAVAVAVFMLLLDITVVNVALPDIQRSLHSSFKDLQWVVNAYSLTLAAFLLIAPVTAHYHMLLPEKASAKKDEAVRFLYQWGHPFEHQLFDAPHPRAVMQIAPDGSKREITQSLEETSVASADGKKVKAWRFRFKPESRGDYLLATRGCY